MGKLLIGAATLVGGYFLAGAVVEVVLAIKDREAYQNQNIGPFTYLDPYVWLRWPRDIPRLAGGDQLPWFE